MKRKSTTNDFTSRRRRRLRSLLQYVLTAFSQKVTINIIEIAFTYVKYIVSILVGTYRAAQCDARECIHILISYDMCTNLNTYLGYMYDVINDEKL